MVERCVLPVIGAVALSASCFHIPVQIIVGFGMATVAFRTDIGFDKRMRKRFATMPGQFGSDMVAMAGNTVVLE